jgi:hypothetical protein
MTINTIQVKKAIHLANELERQRIQLRDVFEQVDRKEEAAFERI